MSYTFARNKSVSEASHSRNVRASIIEYLKWALLEAGSYRNVPQNTVFGALRLQKDLNFTDYRVFTARRGFWPWESGLTQQTTQPTSISVLVNGSTVNASTYIIDYQNGRIIFNSAKLSTDVITANYPFREVVVYDGGDRNYREIDFLSTKVDDLRLATAGGAGVDLDVPNSMKAHLPCIFVNSAYDFIATGYELGSNRLIACQDVTLECYSDNGWYMDWMHDMLVLQKDNNIPSFDLDTAPPSFMSDGTLNAARLTFPNKCINYPGLKIFVKRVSSREMPSYGAVMHVNVTWNVEIYAV